MNFIKDSECTPDTPVILGKQEKPIYGNGVRLKPRVKGRCDSEHFKKIYLPRLLPLEEYDLIVVLISGGKDSVACYLKLIELGVPKEKIEFWHHDIDGGHPTRRMDWKCTQNYVKALADAEGVKLRVSYRVNGFFGELYRIGASEPIEWIDPDTGEIRQCKLSSNYLKCRELKEQATEEMEELLKRHHINPHPCYRIGWNRCSCMMCIFSTPRLFAGVKELFPDAYASLRHDEEVLGFTLDNKKNLDEFIGDTPSCVCWNDKKAIHSILTGEFGTEDIYTENWNYPVGAFHGADGGSC